MLVSGPSVPLAPRGGGGGDAGEGKTVDVTVRVAGKGKRRNRRGKKRSRRKGGVDETRGNIVEEKEAKKGEGRTREKDQVGVCAEEMGRSLKRRRKESKTEDEVENEVSKTEEQSRRENRRAAKKRSVVQPMVRVTVREDDDSSPAVCAGCWYYHLRMIHHPITKHTSTSISTSTPPDIITWRTLLTASLTKLFGVQGSAAQIDILKVSGWDAWVRAVDVGGQVFPIAKGRAFAAAVGGYVGVWRASSDGGEEQVGIRVLRSAKWLVALLGDTGGGGGGGDGDEEADLWKDS